MTDEDCEHCWHSLGTGMTVGTGESGWTEHKCCQCGETVNRQWTIRREQMEGHGPHYKQKIRVYKDEETP